MDKFSSPPSSTPSTDIPTVFSPTLSKTSIKELGGLLIPMESPGSQIPLPPEIAQFLAQHGFIGSDGLPSPFVFSNKSVTTSHGVTENGERFTQQHYTVNTHEWYTPRHFAGEKEEGRDEGRNHTKLLDKVSRELREVEEKKETNGSKMDEKKEYAQLEQNQKVSKLKEKFNQEDFKLNMESKTSENKIFRRLNREPASPNQGIHFPIEKDLKDLPKLTDNKRFNHSRSLQNLSHQDIETKPNFQPMDPTERNLKTDTKPRKHFDFNLIKSYGVDSKPLNKPSNEVLFEKLKQEIKDFNCNIRPSKVKKSQEKARLFNEKSPIAE